MSNNVFPDPLNVNVVSPDPLPVDIVSPLETSDRGVVGVPVFVQEQTQESLDVPFLLSRGSFTLDGDTTRESRFFNAVAGHGIAVGEIVELFDTSTFMQATVLGVLTNAIEVDTPINHVYLGGGLGARATNDMRVDGSVTPQIFSVLPSTAQAGDMTRVILRMESNSAMDFSKFGSSGALLIGCVLRIRRAGGDFRNQLNFKTNGDFIEKAFDSIPQVKSGGGGFGYVYRLTYAGRSKHGVAVRLDGSLAEEWQVVIQDDLTTGFTRLSMTAGGHELQG
jgi:hypothetical protein